MAYENNEKKNDSVYSQRVRAGKRRTYFFDIRETKGNDYYLTITESRKKFNEEGYDRHKIFLYKEDFNKFLKGITDAVNYVKTELMPDFDFDIFNHDADVSHGQPQKPEVLSGETSEAASNPEPVQPSSEAEQSADPDSPAADDSPSQETSHKDEDVDKW